jgi:dynein heavy chain
MVALTLDDSEKNEVMVDAELVDSETIKVKTPNYESFGALPVEVKVSISGEGWTVNRVKFTYFANTSARSCIAYGPGLLEKGVYGIDMPFLIQSIDTQVQNDRAQHLFTCISV